MSVHIPSAGMKLLAPAKVNLHLRVGPPAPDGFHPLLTWMCTVSLFDTLTLSHAEPRLSVSPGSGLIQLSCDDPVLACDETNLIVRAGKVLAENVLAEASEAGDMPANSTREGRSTPRGMEGKNTGLPPPVSTLSPVAIALQKRIPSGAGLGGGSADGAIAMRALNRWWRIGYSDAQLAEWSAACGSDLPFFFYGSSSVCTMRGQEVRPTAPPQVARWGVLMLPRIAMPTPAVYRKFDELKLGDSSNLTDPPDWQAWAKRSAIELLPGLVNDLEAAAFAICPRLGQLRAEAEFLLARSVRMSGSGSSLFTLYDERAEAEIALKAIESLKIQSLVVEIAPSIDDDLNKALELM